MSLPVTVQVPNSDSATAPASMALILTKRCSVKCASRLFDVIVLLLGKKSAIISRVERVVPSVTESVVTRCPLLRVVRLLFHGGVVFHWHGDGC